MPVRRCISGRPGAFQGGALALRTRTAVSPYKRWHGAPRCKVLVGERDPECNTVLVGERHPECNTVCDLSTENET